MPREAIVATSVWLIWYGVGGIGLFRKYGLTVPRSLAAWESGMAVVAASGLCGASLAPANLAAYVLPLCLSYSVLAFLPAGVYRWRLPAGRQGYVASTYHVTMYLGLLASVPWALGTVSYETGEMILAAGAGALWLAWGMGFGLWQRSWAHRVGALGLIGWAAARFAAPALEPLALIVMFPAMFFTQYKAKW